jgi:hypothetical protein
MGAGHLKREDRPLTGNGPLAERSRKVRKLSSCLSLPLNPDPVGFLLTAPLSDALLFLPVDKGSEWQYELSPPDRAYGTRRMP